MIITAKFSSTCPCCNARVQPGDKVEWSKGLPARHVGCAAAPGSVSHSVASVRPYRSFRRSGAGAAAPVAGYSSWCTGRSGCRCYDCAS